MTRISVVIPCYNAGELLSATLESVLRQTRAAAEVIVVDDGSTDDSAERASSFGDPVRVIRGDHRGAAAARNRGAAEATGDAIMFLDADDLLGPDALSALGAALERSPGAVAACPWYRLAWSGAGWVVEPPSCPPRAGRDPLRAWLTGWYHPPCSVLWSRQALERTGGWDDSIEGNPNDDGELMLRALALGVPLRLTADGAAYYRRPLVEGRTLSGKRFSRQGLRSRVRVLEKLVGLLAGQGRLRRYAGAIAEAYDRIALDASAAPDLAERCRTEARRLGGPRYRRRLRAMGTTLRIRALGPLRRLRRRLFPVRHDEPVVA